MSTEISNIKTALRELTETEKELVQFQVTGEHGHSVVLVRNKEHGRPGMIHLIKDGLSMYQASFYGYKTHDIQQSPLSEFLRGVFLLEHWGSTKNRDWVGIRKRRWRAAIDKGAAGMEPFTEVLGEWRPQPTWSECMLDCNVMGYWLNAAKPANTNIGDTERHLTTLVGHNRMVIGKEIRDREGIVSRLNLSYLQVPHQVQLTVADLKQGLVSQKVIQSEQGLIDQQRGQTCIRQVLTYVEVIGRVRHHYQIERRLPWDANPYFVDLDDKVTSIVHLSSEEQE